MTDSAKAVLMMFVSLTKTDARFLGETKQSES
jgi:hypothetical protein